MKKFLLVLFITIGIITLNAAKENKRVDLGKDIGKVNISYSGGGFNNMYRSMHPNILVMNNGDILAVWEEGEDEGHCHIVYRIFDNESKDWIPSIDTKPAIAVRALRSAGFPVLVEDSEGVVHMSYQDGTARRNRDAWYCYYKDGKWSVPQMIIRTINNTAWPRIAVDRYTNDIYATWHRELMNPQIEGDSVIAYIFKKAGSSKWDILRNFSMTVQPTTIHQASAFANGKLYSIFMDGHEGNWNIMANSALQGENGGQAEVISDIESGYWPELAADSQGNLYGIYSTRQGDLFYVYKGVSSGWKNLGAIATNGRIDFFGLTVAPNDVAYAIYQRGIGDGKYAPVFIRITCENVSKPFYIHEARYPKRFKIGVDSEGAVHSVWSDFNDGDSMHSDAFSSDVWYKKIDQAQIGKGPTINIEDVPDTIITGDEIIFNGKIVSNPNEIVNHRWYVGENKICASTLESLTYTFGKAGKYDIHYYVSDTNNLLSHKSVSVEVIDAPYQPTDSVVESKLIKGFLFRRYVNKLTWKNDSRNDGKFENIIYFNIYRREKGEPDWCSISSVTFSNSSVTYKYIDDSIAFKTEVEAHGYEYAVSVVADVNGDEKESKKTFF